MSKKGGYFILDLKENSYSETPITIDGIFKHIESNFYKAILVSGIVIDGVNKNDVFTTLTIDSGNFVFTVYDKIFTITDDDEITVADAPPAGLDRFTLDLSEDTYETTPEDSAYTHVGISSLLSSAINSGKFVEIIFPKDTTGFPIVTSFATISARAFCSVTEDGGGDKYVEFPGGTLELSKTVTDGYNFS